MFFFKYLPSLALAFAPLLTAQYSLLDLMGCQADAAGNLSMTFIPLMPVFVLSGPKSHVEMQLRFLITTVGVVTLVVHGYFDAFRPSRTLKSFRHDYLDQVNEADWRKRNRVRKDVRIN